MNRSGYTEEYDEKFPNAGMFYQSSVTNALCGRRGQAFLRDMIAALDAMPDKRLISGVLECDGEMCAIGSVGVRRGIDMSALNPDDAWAVSKAFGIAESMARQIVYENDERLSYLVPEESPEERWQRMRHWATCNLRTTQSGEGDADIF